jgi:hypothetical protein
MNSGAGRSYSSRIFIVIWQIQAPVNALLLALLFVACEIQYIYSAALRILLG